MIYKQLNFFSLICLVRIFLIDGTLIYYYLYYDYYYYSLRVFFTSALADGLSLSDSMSPQVSRTLLSILADLNNVLVWMVSIRPLIFKSSSPFNNDLMTVPKAPITIGTIVAFMFHSFFNSQARSRYLSFFSLSFNFTLWSAKPEVLNSARSLYFYLFIYLFILFFADVWSYGWD